MRADEANLLGELLLSRPRDERSVARLYRRLAGRLASALPQQPRRHAHALRLEQSARRLRRELASSDAPRHLLDALSVIAPRPVVAVRHAVARPRRSARQPVFEWRRGRSRSRRRRRSRRRGCTLNLNECVPHGTFPGVVGLVQRGIRRILVGGGLAERLSKSHCFESRLNGCLHLLSTSLAWRRI
eukprot:15199-Prymnesium_polylepis.4